jgi:hypothetical protein
MDINKIQIGYTEESRMKHYEISEWVDFVRGLVPEFSSLAMRKHLAEGCSQCRELADFCEKLRTVSIQAESHTAPEWVVRNAKAIFQGRAEPQRTRGVRIPIELVYDSFCLPAAAGLRATWHVGWQALYRAGDCSLDFRVEPEIASAGATVIGQISNHVQPDCNMEGLPVCLKAGKLIVAETSSNRYGEFLLEFEPQGGLHLCVYLDDRSRHFQVPLKTLASERVMGTDQPRLIPGQARLRKTKQKPD